MKNTLRGIAIFAILSTILLSCKKEDLIPINLFQKQANVNDLKQVNANHFKSWYESQKSTISAKIRTNQEQGVDLIFEPLWNNSNVEQIGEYTVFSSGVNTALRNLDDGKTKFNLVIRFNGKSYEGKIVSVRNLAYKSKFSLDTKDLYDLAFTQNEIIKPEINAHIKLLSTNFIQEKEEIIQNGKRLVVVKDPKNVQKSSVGNYTVCFDYFIDMYNYDQYGDLISVTTSYWKTECEVRETQAIWWIDNGDGTYYGGGVVEEQDSRYDATLQAFETDYRARMTQQEKDIFDNMSWTKRVSYLQNAKMAELYVASDSCLNSQATGLRGDAFRHAYFNILNVWQLGGSLAASLGTAHEYDQLNDPGEVHYANMDLFNNNIGRNAFVSKPLFTSAWTFYADIVRNLLDTGQLRYLTGTNLTPSDPCM